MTEKMPETRPMNWHPNYRARGEIGCPLCGREFSAHSERLYIHVGEGGGSIVRADLPTVEGHTGDMAVLSTGPDTGNMGWFEVGATCARKLGPGWSKKLPPLEPVAGRLEETC